MQIETKRDIGDKVSFHPFGKVHLRVSGKIVGINIIIQKKKKHVTQNVFVSYSINVTLAGKTEPWSVTEESIIE